MVVARRKCEIRAAKHIEREPRTCVELCEDTRKTEWGEECRHRAGPSLALQRFANLCGKRSLESRASETVGKGPRVHLSEHAACHESHRVVRCFHPRSLNSPLVNNDVVHLSILVDIIQ